MLLRDKVAIVTGASQGIGKGIAVVLAREGAKVVVNGRYKERLQEVADEIIRNGGDAIPGVADVMDPKQVREMVRMTLEHFGKIDIMVNNAVAPSHNIPFAKTTEEDWEADLGVGLKGYLICTREVVNCLIDQGNGRIINISSSAGKVGSPNLAVYSAAKGAIISFTKALARELSAKGITVNSVAPGAAKTPMQERLSQEFKNYMISTIPLQRYGEPEEVGELVAFVASSRAEYITGQTFSVDGGRTML